MNEILSDKFSNYANALGRLEEVLATQRQPFVIDATIKRFELTFEMAWKALKKFLFSEGQDCLSPRDCLKKGFQFGYLDDEKAWLTILADRNLSSHLYDESEAESIYRRITERHIHSLRALKVKLREMLHDLSA